DRSGRDRRRSRRAAAAGGRVDVENSVNVVLLDARAAAIEVGEGEHGGVVVLAVSEAERVARFMGEHFPEVGVITERTGGVGVDGEEALQRPDEDLAVHGGLL